MKYMTSQGKNEMCFLVFTNAYMKEFLRGLYPRDCLGPRPKRTKMNHLTNLAAFFEQKHHRTASNNNQSTIADSI